MKKWFIVLLVVGIIAAIFVPAYALTTKTLTPDTQKEVDALWQQMQETRSKMLQKYVDAGVITQEQADATKERMKERYEARKQQGFIPGAGMNGAGGCGVGEGCGNGGCGMGGPGRGFKGQYAPQGTVY